MALAGALVAALLAGETLLAPSLDGEDPNASATDRFQASLLAAPVSIADLPFQASGAAAYPPDALAGGIEGSVRLEFIVDTDGKPLNPRVVDADPPGWFESAALETIHDYRFRPYERDGTAYQRLVRARIGFSLD